VNATVTRESLVGLSKQQLSCELSGEAVILHLGSGIYYGLDEVGARIWRLLDTPKSIRSLVETMTEEYEVDSAVCEREVLAFLNQMREAGLVEELDQDC